MRICIVYDCVYPHTVGGAERWYRDLAERLAIDGHNVTYLTLRQWDRGVDPGVDGVDIRVVGPRMHLYAEAGRRRILPPLVFGLGVFWHLLRHGRRYDVVHTASFPYFSLLAAASLRRHAQFRLVVDWHEVWTRAYWRSYLGGAAGTIGSWIQRCCARVPQHAFCFSRMHSLRLRQEGLRGDVTVLRGLYRGADPLAGSDSPAPSEQYVVFAGRQIPEKRAAAIAPAVAHARARLPDLRAVILGDGPSLPEIRKQSHELGLDDAIDLPGFVDSAVVDERLARALCMVLPSSREGYGLVVVEAAARGTPSVVVAAPDNAAVELIVDGVNGIIAPSTSPEDLAAAFLRAHTGGTRLRASTRAWFTDHLVDLSLETSLRTVIAGYGGHYGEAELAEPA